jgi:capsular exopolysaccharide synthesis family protein
MDDRNSAVTHPAPGDVWQDDSAAAAGPRPWQAVNAGGTGGSGVGNGLQNFIAVVLKRRWLILGVTLAALLIALLVTLLMPPAYIARATFQVQREAPHVVDSQTATEGASGTEKDAAFLNTQFALVTSRVTAQGIVRRLNLATNRDFVGGGTLGGIFQNDGTPTPAQLQQAFDAATAKVQSNLTATQFGLSDLIQVQYQDRNPQIATAVANAAIDEFIQGSIERQFLASKYAGDFVGKRLLELKAKLEKSERDLVDYASHEKIISVTDGGKTGAQAQSIDSATLNVINNAAATARAQRVDAQAAWELAQQSGGAALAQSSNDPQINELAGRLATLQADYAQKLQTFRPNFPAMVEQRTQISTMQKQLADLRGKLLQTVKGSYQLSIDKEKALNDQLAKATSQVLDVQSRSIQYMILQREVDTNRALYDALLQRYKEIGVAGGSSSNNVSIIDRARVPGSPAYPILWLNLLIALVGGLAIGLGIAFVLDFLDDTFKMPEDVESNLGLPLLGMIPKLEEGATPLAELGKARSSFVEAYFAARTALQLANANGTPKSLLITSSNPNEGKTTTAISLAQSFAEQGKRVLLVDADMRRPSLHKILGFGNTDGLANTLTGERRAADVIVHDSHGFDVLTSGPTSPNPARLLSGGLRSLLSDLETRYDLVIFDGPPVVGLADVPILASAIQETVLVIQARKSRRRVVMSALRRLRTSRNAIVGVILTKFDHRSADYAYTYAYSSYYYSYGDGRTA